MKIGTSSKPIDQVDLHRYEVEQDNKLGLLMKLLEKERGTFLVLRAPSTARIAWRSALPARALRPDAFTAIARRTSATRLWTDSRPVSIAFLSPPMWSRAALRRWHRACVNYDLPQVPEDFIHRVGDAPDARALVWHRMDFRHSIGAIRDLKFERALSINLVMQAAGDLPPVVMREPLHEAKHAVAAHVSKRVDTRPAMFRGKASVRRFR